jgi:ABC-type lipoprotein export system ATPase subunit
MAKTDKPILVETSGLTKIYNDGEVRALDGVNLVIRQGELVTIMGPSGSGKSTLLNMFGALDQPTSGTVTVKGIDLSALEDVDSFRGETVGFIFQLHNLLPTMTAQENVEVPMMGHATPAERKERSQLLLSLVGLSDRMRHLPPQLSGGQRQRVAVARALANNPPLVLADEPTGSLDSESGRALMDLLKEINAKQGTTIIVVTHDPAVARQTNRVVVMSDGKIAREDIIGTPLEEDLKMWKHSGLGQRLISEAGDIGQLKLSKKEKDIIKQVLEKNGEG